MAEDKVEVLGRWLVKFGQFTWEYVFTDDGVVRWKDPFNNENGIGRWSLTPKTVYLSWSKSATKETWNRPVKRTGQCGWIEASYRTGSFEAEKIDQLILPENTGASDIDLELDPTTGEYVQSDPNTHARYIDRVFAAVAYGILPNGYYIYCQGMELPILAPESMVDFQLDKAERERKIFNSFAEAISAANDSARQRRVAYFWGAGGAVVSPTIIGPATTPELYSTIIAVRNLRDQFVGVMLPAITLAIGMIGGPTPMTVKGNQGKGRIAARRGGKEPARTNPVLPTMTRPRAGRSQLQEILSNPMDHLTFRTRDLEVASNKSLDFTGATNPMAPQGIYACRGTGHRGYGPYGVTVKVSKVSVRTVPGKADEFVITSPIEAGDGVWWHESDLAGLKK